MSDRIVGDRLRQCTGRVRRAPNGSRAQPRRDRRAASQAARAAGASRARMVRSLPAPRATGSRTAQNAPFGPPTSHGSRNRFGHTALVQRPRRERACRANGALRLARGTLVHQHGSSRRSISGRACNGNNRKSFAFLRRRQPSEPAQASLPVWNDRPCGIAERDLRDVRTQ